MTRQILVVIVLLVVEMSSNAQELSFAFNSTFSGRNCALTYIQKFEKSEIGMGFRYNINQWTHPHDQNNMFYKRLYAFKPLHHVGGQVYYHHFVWSNIFVFYDIQVSYSETLTRLVQEYCADPAVENPIRYDPENEIPTHDDFLYKKRIERFGPFTWVEQNIGVGIKYEITESVFLSQKAGIGVCMLIGEDEQLPQTWNGKPEVCLCGLLNIALTYKFK